MFNKQEALKSKSKSILDVFTKTINKLSEVNKEISSENDLKQLKISQIEKEKEELNQILLENNKVISKLSSIFQ